VDDDCSTAVNNSECADGRCRCSYDHLWSPAAAECLYDGYDSRQKVVGTALVVAAAFVGVVDVLMVACLVANCAAVVAVRRRRRLANRRRTDAGAV